MAKRIRSRISAPDNADRKDSVANQPLIIDLLAERRRRLDRKTTLPAVRKREPLLTLKEVAEILKVSVKQVRRYIADPDPRKRLRSIKIGGLIRIDPYDLEDFIRDHRCPQMSNVVQHMPAYRENTSSKLGGSIYLMCFPEWVT